MRFPKITLISFSLCSFFKYFRTWVPIPFQEYSCTRLLMGKCTFLCCVHYCCFLIPLVGNEIVKVIDRKSVCWQHQMVQASHLNPRVTTCTSIYKWKKEGERHQRPKLGFERWGSAGINDLQIISFTYNALLCYLVAQVIWIENIINNKKCSQDSYLGFKI